MHDLLRERLGRDPESVLREAFADPPSREAGNRSDYWQWCGGDRPQGFCGVKHLCRVHLATRGA